MRHAIVVLALLALAPAAAHAAAPGELTQLPGKAGCFVDPAYHVAKDGCAKARGMSSTQNVVISPDGRNVYAPSNWTWGLVSFRRKPSNGRLTQLPGGRGCFTSQPGHKGCARVRGLVWAFWVAVSPDGRNVYASGGIGNSIAVFSRRQSDGALTQLAGPAGCVRNRKGGTTQGGPPPEQSGCALVDNLVYPRTILVSPDGRFLYAATFDGRTITTFARDPATGALTPLPNGCVSQAPKPGCGPATTLAGATDLAMSRDGRFLYATAFKGNAVVGFTRDPQTGLLTQLPAPGGCLAATATPACASSRGLKGAYNLALSPNGRHLYVASRSRGGALAALTVDPATGALSQATGRAGCAAAHGSHGCAAARGLAGARGVAVSPDGRTVYAGSFTDSALTTFSRTPSTGALRQIGCLAAKPHPGCRHGRAVRHAWGIAVSRDGRFVYSGVGGDANTGLAVFARRK
jgi:6-phosphogluconolactonase (cycloisomerase 2 family)